MFPDRAVMYVASMEDNQYKNDKFSFWSNVYGVDMSPIKKWVLLEPLVDVIKKAQVNSDSCCILV